MQKSSVQRLRQALGGVSGVHVTPYDASGAIAHAQLMKVVDFIAAAGVRIPPFKLLRQAGARMRASVHGALVSLSGFGGVA